MNDKATALTSQRVAFVLLFVGASLYWPLLRRNGLFFSLAGHDSSQAESLAWLTAFLLLCALFVAICCVRQSEIRKLVDEHSRLVVGVFGAQAVCKVAETFVQPAGLVEPLLAFVDVSLYAFAFVTLTYMWASWYVSMERRESVLFSSATFAASFVIADLVRLLPETVGLVAFALFPFASALSWVALRKTPLPDVPTLLARPEQPEEQAPAHGKTTPAPRGARFFTDTSRDIHSGVTDRKAVGSGVVGPGSPAPFTWNLVVLLAVFLLVGGLIRGAMTGVVDGSLSQIMLPMDAAVVLFGIVLLVFSVLQRPVRHYLLNAWSLAVIVFFAGLLLAAGFSGDSVERGRQVVIIGRTCLDLIYWIVLVGLVRDERLSLLRTIGVWFVLVDVLSSLLGYVFAPMAMAIAGVSIEGAAVPLASAAAFILIAASILFFNRTFSSDVERMPSSQAQPSADVLNPQAERARFVESALADYKLTDRELEVAELLADGNSQKKIAEMLYVSLGTVQSHIKSVYRKLGIHSRQELIDMMRG